MRKLWIPARHGQAIVRWTDGDAVIPMGPMGRRLLEITAGRLGAYLEEAVSAARTGGMPVVMGQDGGGLRDVAMPALAHGALRATDGGQDGAWSGARRLSA
jgi:hypothetical protein